MFAAPCGGARMWLLRVKVCVVISRPRTTRRAPHIYPDISGDGFQYYSSHLTFSDEWVKSVSTVPSHAPRGHGFDSRFCHIPTAGFDIYRLSLILAAYVSLLVASY